MRRPLLLLSFVISVLLASITLCPAAPKKKKTSAAEPVPAATGSLRVWKGDFESKRAVTLILRPSGRGSESTVLGEFGASGHFGDYLIIPSGAATLEVLESDGAKPVASLPLQTSPDSFSTLALREVAGTLTLELLDDHFSEDSSPELVVRNFVPGLRSVQLDGGPNLQVRLTGNAGFLHLRGLPSETMSIHALSTDASGTEFEWINEVDFRKSRRATLLIRADAYGRIRPRVVVDAPTAGK